MSSSSDHAGDQPSNEQKQRRLVQAAGALATQCFIHYVESHSGLDQATLAAYESTKHHKIPTPSQYRKMLSRLVGRCEIAFRSSVCTDFSVTRHSGILIEAASCAVIEKRADLDGESYMDMFEDILRCVDMSPSMPLNGYGRRCDVEKEADGLHAQFEAIHKVHAALIGIVSKQRMLEQTESREGVRSVGDTLMVIRAMLSPSTEYLNKETRQRILSHMMTNFNKMAELDALLNSLKTRVSQHVQERVERGRALLSTDTLDEDCLMKVLEFVDYRSASACLATCRSLRDKTEIRKLMPHLSFRHIPGVFPHVVADGIDGGVCNYVSKKALTHVYVDLAITGMRRHDPESVRIQTTREHSGREDPIYMGRDERLAIATEQKKMAARTAPDEVVDASRFRRRLCHESFFSTPIKCSFSLVCATTHEEIPESLAGPPLTLPKWMRKPDAPNHTYTSRDNVPYPAHAAFHVEELSNDYKDRKFKIKVVGTARTLPNERNDEKSVYVQTLVAYSQPFEIVSHKAVSANVRKRAQESKQRVQNKQAKASLGQ